MTKKIVFVLCVLLVLSPATLVARSGGGGGMNIGYQTSSYPFLERYPVTANTMELIYYGGVGYGVSWDRTITGGFGYAIMDVTGDSEIAGGFGGFIGGFRLLDRPINISILSWTGLGGISTGVLPAYGHEGFFGLLQEITLEMGFPVIRWFMPTLFAGYQVAGNLIPGVPFEAFFSYTPVVGFRLHWGSFY
jgi:hypothetical protein